MSPQLESGRVDLYTLAKVIAGLVARHLGRSRFKGLDLCQREVRPVAYQGGKRLAEPSQIRLSPVETGLTRA